MDARAHYELQLDLIQQLIEICGRRHHLSETDKDDFGSFVHMKVMDNDFRIIRGFGGKSSFRTFMTVVVQRLYQDFRNQQWGKWRLSAEAKRQGETGILLETLMARDGYGFEQACEIIITNHGLDVSRDELAQIASVLPVRMPRRQVTEDHLNSESSDHGNPEEYQARDEWQDLQTRTEQALGRAVTSMNAEDKVILELLYKGGVKIVRIAKMLGLDQRRLYRRVEKILKQCRTQLEQSGIGSEEVASVIGRTYGSISINFGDDPEKNELNSSNTNGDT